MSTSPNADDEPDGSSERLRARQAQLAEAQELAQIGSWEFDFQTGQATWSDELYRQLGLAPGSVPASESLFHEYVHPDDREGLSEATRSLIRQTRESYEMDHRILRKDGSVIFVRSRGRLVRDPQGRPLRLVGTGQDITLRKQLEQKVALAGRLASVGTLASGVAHDINNPLTYVIGNLELMTRRVVALGAAVSRTSDAAALTSLTSGLSELISEAARGAERVRRVVSDLRVFSRAADEVNGPVSVEAVLESSIRLAANQIRHRAVLVRAYQPVPQVQANEARLGQVFLNLLLNAAQSIPESAADRREIHVATRSSSSGSVVIEVRDTGVGIAPELVPRVFDPFFSTKDTGMGMGLGLWICHSLVTSLGGRIECESDLGCGTTMRVSLPPARVPTPRPLVESVDPVRSLAQVDRLFVVDDEPMMFEFMQRMLAPDFQVSGTTRGAEALALLGREDPPFDVLVLDLMMPELGGMDLYESLLARAPDYQARTLFVTGGAFTPRARAFLDRLPTPWLQKPFGAHDLRRAIARLPR